MGDDGTTLPSPPLPARLGQWIDWRHAVALSAALDARPSPPPGEASPCTPAEDGACARLRAVLVKAIEGDRAFSLTAPSSAPAHGKEAGAEDEAPDYAFFRQRYMALQQVMEAEIGHLRGRVRGMVARHAASLQQLAAMDAVMERALGRHERALLSALPEMLGKHFERQRLAALEATPAEPSTRRAPTAWLDHFRTDMQRLLLAELDIRLQPAEGLLAALRNTPHG